jgi:site-specific recombinase XerD
MGGVDLKIVQELMGQKTIAMTDWYALFASDSQVEGVGDTGVSVVSFVARR